MPPPRSENKLKRVISDHPEFTQPSYDDDRVSPPTRPPSPRSSPTLHEHDQDGASLRRKKEQQLESGSSDRDQQMNREKTEVEDPETRDWPDDVVLYDSKEDPANPKNFPKRRKIMITFLFGLTTMCSTFASSVFSPAFKYISVDYDVSTEVVTLGVSLFVAGYIFGPLIWAPLSELYGRRPAVIYPMIVFVAFTAGTATATNIQTIMITRFFSGLMACAPVTNVGGGLADLFDQRERGTAVVFYSLAVVAGPTLGPVIGAAVAQSYLGWRWTEYLSIILTCTVLLIFLAFFFELHPDQLVFDFFFLPETYTPVILTRKARMLRLKTKRWALHSKKEEQDFAPRLFIERNLLRPLKMIAFEPMVTCLTLYNSFAYGILYLLFSAVPIVYEGGRGWNTLVGSLPFLATLVGTLIAAAINIAYSHFRFGPYLDAHGGKARPEERLPPMMLGAVTFPIGFFLLGWTSDPSIHWFPSIFGLVLIGMSFLLIFQAGINYLIDAYTKEAVSAVAANTFLRSIFAAALPLVALPLFNRLGVNYACTLLGCIAVLLAFVPFTFYHFGPRLRARSSYAANS